MKVKLIAERNFYSWKRGEKFTHNAVMARAMVIGGLASYDDEPEEVPSEPVPIKAARKRIYKRRDLTAE